jgi:hypothetical protein
MRHAVDLDSCLGCGHVTPSLAWPLPRLATVICKTRQNNRCEIRTIVQNNITAASELAVQSGTYVKFTDKDAELFA